jgi:hypothetical protein
VSYQASEYGAEISIGNTSEDIIIVTEPTFHWTYQACPKLTEPKVGAPMLQYRYTVKLSKKDDSKLLDSRPFKYGNGEAGNFVIDLHFPGTGVYTMWFSLRYKYLGDSRDHPYETKQEQVSICSKY